MTGINVKNIAMDDTVESGSENLMAYSMADAHLLKPNSKSVLSRLRTTAFAMAATCMLALGGNVALSPSVQAETVDEEPAIVEVDKTTQATVNINDADAKTLAKLLKGIGLKKAEAIVAYRTENGKFTDVAQLSQVKGIGKSTVKKNEANIAL